VNLYDCLSELPELPVLSNSGTDPRPDTRRGGTTITATIETTDEERTVGLLGTFAP
jgi:hypothetical protein